VQCTAKYRYIIIIYTYTDDPFSGPINRKRSSRKIQILSSSRGRRGAACAKGVEPRRKGFFAEVHEFKGFVGAREEVMDDRIICI